MSKTRITISARKRPKKPAKPKPDEKQQDKSGGGPDLPGDRFTNAQCRITVADFSTLYLFTTDEDGHAIIASSNNSEVQRDTGGTSMRLDFDATDIANANIASLDLWG